MSKPLEDPREERFAQFYGLCRDADDAALRAGYPLPGVARAVTILLDRRAVLARIQEIEIERLLRAEQHALNALARAANQADARLRADRDRDRERETQLQEKRYG